VAHLSSPSLLWRYGCHRDRMTWVMSSQGVVPVPLLTVHGHVHHVDGANTVLGGPVAPRLALGFHVPLGRGAEIRRRGSGAFDDAVGARARRRNGARDAYCARVLSARLGRERVYCSRLQRLTHCQCFWSPTMGLQMCRVPYFTPC
jgi:hypothetical protein